jgi:hypothetical protein
VSVVLAVTIRPVRTISRKLLSGIEQDPQRLYVGLVDEFDLRWCRDRTDDGEDTVRPPWRHGELGRNDPAHFEQKLKLLSLFEVSNKSA